MANEVVKITDQNGVDHPIKDLAAFPRSEQAVLGAKNLMPWPYYYANGSEYGVTWVTNNDGTVTVSTPNGPSTGQANIHLIRPQNFPSWLLNVPLKLSGCPSGGDSLKYEMSTYLYDGTNTAHDYGDGNVPFMFTSAGEKQLSITVRPNVTISTPITFKPMITLASDTECDYEHFVSPAMTNKELTKKVTPEAVSVTPVEGVTLIQNNSYKEGNLLHIACMVKATASDGYLPNGSKFADLGVTIPANTQICGIFNNGTNPVSGNAVTINASGAMLQWISSYMKELYIFGTLKI